MSDRPTRIDKAPGRGWVVRSLEGRILMPPFRTRDEARLAAERYRTQGGVLTIEQAMKIYDGQSGTVDNLPSSNKRFRTTIGLTTK